MTFERWKSLTEWPLAAAALIFLGAYAWTVLANISGPASAPLEFVMAAVWVFFTVDYVVSLALAKPRGRWFVTHLHDLLIVVLPALRPLRLLRLVTLISVLHRTAGSALRGRVTMYAVSASVLLVLVAGLAVLDAEQNVSGANITTFGDAIWWAFATITTVGYGDYFPVTLVGRLVAVGLMVSGIALLGTVTATIASWFIELVRQPEKMPDSDS
ncbi:MAG: potassium channel family protein [Rhodoglobus sp.]